MAARKTDPVIRQAHTLAAMNESERPAEARRRQTAAARATRSRLYEERLAAVLRSRGWTVVPPKEVEGQL